MVDLIIFVPIRCPYCGTNVVIKKGIYDVHCTGCSKSFNAWGL